MLSPLPMVPVQHTPSLPPALSAGLPTLITDEGENAAHRFVEFFTARIRNKNTRQAYARATGQFLNWCEQSGLTLHSIKPMHVGTYIEQKITTASTATVKQHLAALKHVFDWMVLGQVMASNPALSVRGPKLSRSTETTPILTEAQARQLLDSIPTNTLAGLRDKAIISVMLYTFARVTALTSATVAAYRTSGTVGQLRLKEKGGKEITVPLHHEAQHALAAYLEAAGIADQKKTPLFRSVQRHTRGRVLSDQALARQDVWAMIRRRCKRAGLSADTFGCHTMRGTGITAYLSNQGSLELAQGMANHADIGTTRLYDRRNQRITQSEVERIRFDR